MKHPLRARRGLIVLILAVIIGLVVAAVWLVRSNANDQPAAPGVPHNQTMPSSGSNNPDPVKQKNGPNGEISPTPTGTGPGSDRSLLGPHQ